MTSDDQGANGKPNPSDLPPNTRKTTPWGLNGDRAWTLVFALCVVWWRHSMYFWGTVSSGSAC